MGDKENKRICMNSFAPDSTRRSEPQFLRCLPTLIARKVQSGVLDSPQ